MSDAASPVLASLAEVRCVPLTPQSAANGSLAAIESGRDVPFAIIRTFHVWNVPAGARRGCHAHRRCRQVLICVAGSCRVICRDGESEREFRLDQPDQGLYVPPTVWAEQIYETEGTVLLVLTDRAYEAEDYVRDWSAYLRLRGVA